MKGALRLSQTLMFLLFTDSDVLLQAKSFKVVNKNGKTIMKISPNHVETNFRSVKLHGRAQALKSLQTKQIFSKTKMKIAAPTKSLEIQTVEDLNLMTTIGKMELKALKNLEFSSKEVSK